MPKKAHTTAVAKPQRLGVSTGAMENFGFHRNIHDIGDLNDMSDMSMSQEFQVITEFVSFLETPDTIFRYLALTDTVFVVVAWTTRINWAGVHLWLSYNNPFLEGSGTFWWVKVGLHCELPFGNPLESPPNEPVAMPGGKTLLGISLDLWPYTLQEIRRSDTILHLRNFLDWGSHGSRSLLLGDFFGCLKMLNSPSKKPLWFFLESGMPIPIFWRQTHVFHPCRSRATGIAAFWSTTALKRRWAAAGSPKQSVTGKANQVSCAERDVDQHFRTLNTLVSCS